jgi:hypothetical protein
MTVSMRTLQKGVREHAVAVFFVLTYLISWGVWVPLALTGTAHPVQKLGTFGPTIAALLLTALLEGRRGLREIGRRLTLWRVPIGWYLFSLFGTAVVVGLSIALHGLLGGSTANFSEPVPLFPMAVIGFVYVLFTSVLGEEIGWRGYALPHLQARHGALTSSLIIGVVWGLWHLPLFYMAGDFHRDIPLTPFILQDVALSVIYTWMFNHTRGSLLLPHLFHTASNLTLGMLPILPMSTGGATRPLWLAVGLVILFAAGLSVAYGPEKLGSQRIQKVPSR